MSRLDFLTVELDEVNQKCVHSRLLILGGQAGPNGNMCGKRYRSFVAYKCTQTVEPLVSRSKEVTLLEVKGGEEVKILFLTQKGTEHRWNIAITQVKLHSLN